MTTNLPQMCGFILGRGLHGVWIGTAVAVALAGAMIAAARLS